MRLEIDIHHSQGAFTLKTNLLIKSSATGLFGHSGSGKSTLLRCIAGLTRPGTGLIRLDGQVLFDSATRICVPPHKRRIGIVFQEPRLFPHWSVRKNLRSGRKPGIAHPYSMDQIVELMQISHLLDRAVPDLSGGEKQRISLARTLLAHPRLLLMDEPLSGLDVRLKSRILPFLDRINHELGIPTMIVSHDLSDILALSDHLILLKDGAVAAHGSLEEVVKNDEMIELIHEKDLNPIISHQLHGRAVKATTRDGKPCT